jgi:hypothetical protein
MKTLVLAGMLGFGGLNPFHICGDDDRQYTNYYDGAFDVSYDWVQRYAEPVVQIRGCSGTLIDTNAVITAMHCQIDLGDTVKLGYLKDIDDYPTYRVTKVLEKSNWTLDYAIYEVSGDPSNHFAIRELTPEVPSIGDEIYILGHPRLRRLTITAGPLVGLHANDAQYRADSQGGSSGAGVLDSEGRMFALHQRGSCAPGWSGYNMGTLIDKIKDASPIVRRLLGLKG